MWGWLISLFVLPEVLAHMVFPKRNFVGRKRQYRMIFGGVSVVLVLMMMAANLVGFALGLDGLQGMLKGIFASYSGMLLSVSLPHSFNVFADHLDRLSIPCHRVLSIIHRYTGHDGD